MKFLKRLFQKNSDTLLPKGLIVVKPTEQDWKYDLSEIVTSSQSPTNWIEFLPKFERQSIMFTFDTSACTTFSILSSIESQLKTMTLPQEHLTFLKTNGYFVDGEINFSDRFTAITSETKRIGNTFNKVADTIRAYGLVPEINLPFGEAKSWDEWHDVDLLKPQMFKLGEEFKRYFDVTYRHVYFKSKTPMQSHELQAMQELLKTKPLIAGIPEISRHAVMLIKLTDTEVTYYDTYSPFIKTEKIKGTIHFVMSIEIQPRKQVITAPFTRLLRVGTRGSDVAEFQQVLKTALKLDDSFKVDGIFGGGTHNQVVRFQKLNNLKADGIVGQATAKALYSSVAKNVVHIKRFHKEKSQTRGELYAYNTDRRYFSCKTVELPWKNNHKMISCIPAGIYEMKMTFSPKFNKQTYELMNVKDRTAIRIHSANFYHSLQGCIALGREFKHLDKDGSLDVTESTVTINEFEAFLNRQPATLIIED